MSEFLNNDKKVNCPACGGENKAANTFCMNCGERIMTNEAADSAPPPAAEPVAPAPEQPKAPEQAGYERADAEVVSSTPWYNEGNANPYQNTGSSQQAQPTYNQTPPTYNQAPYGPGVNQPSSSNNGLAIASLVCGIVAIALTCCYIGIVSAVAGLITGIISLAKKQGGTGMAIAGVILSGLSFIICVIMIFVLLAFTDSGFGYDYFNDFYF